MAEEPEEIVPEILIEPEQMAGTWANFAKVSHSPYEFTLDFVRLEFGEKPPRGIVVSRVSVSPLFISQLIEALSKNWELYARKALPQEVYQHDDSSGNENDAPEDDSGDDDD